MTLMKSLAFWLFLCIVPSLFGAEANVPSRSQAAPEPRARFLCSLQAPYGQWRPFVQFISGMDSSVYSLSMTEEQQKDWSNHSKISNSAWNGLQGRYLNRIDTWRDRSLNKAQMGNVAFYPFGGPDVANMFAFFPDAREYVLLGLEPVGCVPAGVPDYDRAYFSDLRRSLGSMTSIGFFRTKDMHRDFQESTVNGVLPLLLFLVGRAGYSVVDVNPISITPAGIAANSVNQLNGETRGVEIQFTDGLHGMRTLRYFSVNLQDSRLLRKPGTIKYFGSLGNANTLIKDASYLMHNPYFSIIRKMILSQSRVIVEDDSGIPFRFFDQSSWDVRLYGSYAEPIDLFRRWHQEDLKTAFESSPDVQPLDFAIGYRKRNESHLLLVTRK
jgi:hypothetical protein